MCVTCEELLVDLTYCQHGRKLYCERHYAELIRPRCPACDEVSNVFLMNIIMKTKEMIIYSSKKKDVWSAQLVACLGLRSGVRRLDSWVRHILSLVISYW